MPPRQRNARGEGGRLRDDLLAGAQRILERTGSEDAVTLRAVAREAGVSAPSIYAHFADGAAIVDALVRQTFQELFETLREAQASAAPGDALTAVCLAYIGFGLDHPERYLTLFERRRSRERTRELAAEGAIPVLRGADAFGILVDSVCESFSVPRDIAMEEATVLWVGLHGYVTLRTAMPRFPWFGTDDDVCARLIERAATVR